MNLQNNFDIHKKIFSPENLEPVTDTEKRTITGLELLNTATDETPMLVYGLLPKIGLACLYGESDCGKSTFLRQLGISVSTGQEHFLGFLINATYNNVLIVSTEDGQENTAAIFKKQINSRLEDNTKLNNIHFLFNSEYASANIIKEELLKRNYDLVIIDCLGDAFNGLSTNDQTQMRKFLNQYNDLANEYKCLIIFLHHTGKRLEEKEPSKHNAIGTQAIQAKCRVMLEFRIDYTETDFRHLVITKANYLPPSEKKASYRLKFDENQFWFIDTGTRTPVEELVKPVNTERENKKEKVTELKSQGKTTKEISKELGISTGFVSKLFNS